MGGIRVWIQSPATQKDDTRYVFEQFIPLDCSLSFCSYHIHDHMNHKRHTKAQEPRILLQKHTDCGLTDTSQL